MREILFRGKSKDGLRWVYGSLYKEGSQVFILVGGRFYPEPSNGQSALGIVDWYEVFPDSIGQFTGLVDRDGERIFEGDILGFAIRHSSKGTVVYDYSGFSFVWDEDTARVKKEIKMEWIPTNVSTMWEVIGNIHDNPELLT